MLTPGEAKAWEILESMEPATVCRNASVGYNEAKRHYIIKSFDYDFFISPDKKSIGSNSSGGEILVSRYGYFFIHSCLWYLIHSRDIPLTGRLVRPVDIKDGAMFFRGSHVLPLDKLAERYGNDRASFLKKTSAFGAVQQDFGDVSVRLSPLPRIPVTIILWLSDEEFPARADLLFDPSSELQSPVDILWSIAMLSILALL